MSIIVQKYYFAKVTEHQVREIHTKESYRSAEETVGKEQKLSVRSRNCR